MVQFKTEYNIGDTVFYNLPNSPEGVVVDIQYYHSTGSVYYMVQWDPESNPSTCRGYELLREKRIV